MTLEITVLSNNPKDLTYSVYGRIQFENGFVLDFLSDTSEAQIVTPQEAQNIVTGLDTTISVKAELVPFAKKETTK